MNKIQLDDTTQLMVLIPTTVLLLVLAVCISRQPQSKAELAFSVSRFVVPLALGLFFVIATTLCALYGTQCAFRFFLNLVSFSIISRFESPLDH